MRALLLTTSLLAFAAMPLFAQQDPPAQESGVQESEGPPIRVIVEEVTVPFIVTDNRNRIITDLKQEDFIWAENAVTRLERVPQGFMRDNTRTRVMGYAVNNNIKEITLEVCEAGIRESVKLMEEAIANGASLEDFLPKKSVGA